MAASSPTARCSAHILSFPSSTDSAATGASSSSTVAGEDRLTGLPDALCLHILSLLPLKYAIRTGALSSRWHDLWKYCWPHPSLTSPLSLPHPATSSPSSTSSPPTPSTSRSDSLPLSTSRTTFAPAGCPPLRSLPPSPALPLSDTVRCFPSLPRHYTDPPLLPLCSCHLPSFQIRRSPLLSPPARMPLPVAIDGSTGASHHCRLSPSPDQSEPCLFAITGIDGFVTSLASSPPSHRPSSRRTPPPAAPHRHRIPTPLSLSSQKIPNRGILQISMNGSL